MESGKKFVVDEGGNKRQAISAEDIKQTLNDLVQWFKDNAPAYYHSHLEGSTGLSEGDAHTILKQFGAETSTALSLYLQKCNGGLHFLETFRGIKADEI